MGELFWMLVFLSVLQPLLRGWLQEIERRTKMRQLERERGSRMILIVHRQAAAGFLGLSLPRFIGLDDAEEVIHAIEMTHPDTPIDVVLHTPGGLALAALQIARALKAHPAKVTAFVPHHAMSGGTLIALAADEIVMTEHAVLGPVDPVIGTAPAASLLRVLEQKPARRIDDETLVLADQASKALAQVRATVAELVEGTVAPERRDEIVRQLTSGLWTHDYPISRGRAEELGLPVGRAMPPAVLELVRLYPEAAHRSRTVDYLPVARAPAAGAIGENTSCPMRKPTRLTTETR